MALGMVGAPVCFTGRAVQVRLMLLAALAGEHILFIGPPGTAKSELGRRLARLSRGRFFERLLTRFSVPEVRRLSWWRLVVVADLTALLRGQGMLVGRGLATMLASGAAVGPYRLLLAVYALWPVRSEQPQQTSAVQASSTRLRVPWANMYTCRCPCTTHALAGHSPASVAGAAQQSR